MGTLATTVVDSEDGVAADLPPLIKSFRTLLDAVTLSILTSDFWLLASDF